MKLGSPPLEPALGIRPPLHKWFEKKPRLEFAARNVRAARAWQRKARAKFLECLGETPKQVALRQNVLERRQMKGYHRTAFTLTTAPHIKALCWLCIPDGVTKANPQPAMIATPGHGIGAKDILAMDERGNSRREGVGIQKDYALQAVRLGYPVLVIEPMGFGERRDKGLLPFAKTLDTGCEALSQMATMFGTTAARIRMNDIQRGLDFLETVGEIDANRVGLMGISGGGQMSLWTAAAETRLKLVVVSGYFNRFRDSVLRSQNWCYCYFVPALARWLEMSDLAALVAPRPILFESGTKDAYFPVNVTRKAIQKARRAYRVFGAASRVEDDIFVGGHQWSGRKLRTFLSRWL